MKAPSELESAAVETVCQPAAATGPAMTMGMDPNSRFLIWSIAAVLTCLPVLLQARMDKSSHSIDFVYFYSVSTILRDSGPANIYNPELQIATAQKILPVRDAKSSYGISPYPPFVALLFAPASRLPFWTAFRVQQAVSLALYLLGLVILLRRFFPEQPLRSSLFLPFALAYLPWISNTWLNGQLSALGFVAVALALSEQKAGNPFRSGLALSVCLYKPTLLVLLIPMLLFQRQFRALLGFAAGGCALVGAATAAFGWHIWVAYARLALSLGDLEKLRQLSQYVDLEAFFTMLIGGRLGGGRLASVLTVLVTICALSFLIAAWRGCRHNAPLAWAGALTSTLILSPYVPVYDTILLIPSLIASAASLETFRRNTLPAALFLLFACSWVSVALASLIHLQLLTLAIGTLAFVQIAAALRLTLPNPAS